MTGPRIDPRSHLLAVVVVLVIVTALTWLICGSMVAPETWRVPG